jgi:DNA-binding PadR family transcriptional regulator
MSKVDLVLLGLLSECPRHGYDILQQIEKREMKHWIGVSTPGIYKGLARLEAKQVLRARQEAGDSHPDRTVYEITPQGRDYIQRLLAEAIAEPAPIYFPLLWGVGFAHLMERKTLLAELAARRERIAPLREALDDEPALHAERGFPFTADFITEYYRELLDLELAWLERLEQRVRRTRNWPEGAFTR